jgi:nucleoside-diphosphate-sugar epimerase
VRDERRALVAGATGLVGRRIADELAGSGWTVTGLARRPDAHTRYPLLAADLAAPDGLSGALESLSGLTHIFYAARYDHPEGRAESVEVNAAMLRHLIEAVEPRARGLRHVHLVHGTKHYGHMLGPLPVPLREDAPRARAPNFYFEHEDYIRMRQRGRSWTYSISRPHTFCDAAATEPRNIALLIAVYATVQRALRAPLIFPGSRASFEARTQFTFVPMLARAAQWMATTAACANQAYNITNGDTPRWSALWEAFAGYFGVANGGAQPVRLADYMADKAAVWQRLVSERGLVPTALHEIVAWPYADYVFAPEWDIISDTSKARGAGFTERIDSQAMFIDLFERFRGQRIIP